MIQEGIARLKQDEPSKVAAWIKEKGHLSALSTRDVAKALAYRRAAMRTNPAIVERQVEQRQAEQRDELEERGSGDVLEDLGRNVKYGEEAVQRFLQIEQRTRLPMSGLNDAIRMLAKDLFSLHRAERDRGLHLRRPNEIPEAVLDWLVEHAGAVLAGKDPKTVGPPPPSKVEARLEDPDAVLTKMKALVELNLRRILGCRRQERKMGVPFPGMRDMRYVHSFLLELMNKIERERAVSNNAKSWEAVENDLLQEAIAQANETLAQVERDWAERGRPEFSSATRNPVADQNSSPIPAPSQHQTGAP